MAVTPLPWMTALAVPSALGQVIVCAFLPPPSSDWVTVVTTKLGGIAGCVHVSAEPVTSSSTVYVACHALVAHAAGCVTTYDLV